MAQPAGRTLSKSTQEKLIRLVQSIQIRQQKNTEFIDKLRNIDRAYALSKIKITDPQTNIVEEVIKVPVVASEVDTVSAELIDVFANQEPLIGVIADRGKEEYAMQFQALLGRDARQQGWARQITLLCSNAARYNIAGIEVDRVWQTDLTVDTDIDTLNPKFNSTYLPVTNLKALDMYNSLFDYRVAPADLARDGEYIGYNELYSRTRLKQLGNILSDKETIYNATDAYNSQLGPSTQYWNIRPDISNIPDVKPEDNASWINWLGILNDSAKVKLMADSYMVTKLYVRIIPSEFDISSSAKPIIVQLRVINNQYLFSYKEIYTPLDILPILFCDLREDGFGYQTQSVGENVDAYQQVATELLDVRLEGSKRALDDRALYDSTYLDTNHVNSRIRTRKIPLKAQARNSGDRPRLSELYYPIPFDASATISALQDMSMILNIKDDVNGTNFARRGEQVPGNRTLGEFNTLKGSSSRRTVPYNLRMEEQVMIPLRMLIKVYTLATTTGIQKVIDHVKERELSINMAELRKVMLDYRLTGGLKQKQSIIDPGVLSSALQLLQNNPILAQNFDQTDVFIRLMAAANIDISQSRIQTNGVEPGNTTTSIPPSTAEPGNQGTA